MGILIARLAADVVPAEILEGDGVVCVVVDVDVDVNVVVIVGEAKAVTAVNAERTLYPAAEAATKTGRWGVVEGRQFQRTASGSGG